MWQGVNVTEWEASVHVSSEDIKQMCAKCIIARKLRKFSSKDVIQRTLVSRRVSSLFLLVSEHVPVLA